jgi:hypothetical protein
MFGQVIQSWNGVRVEIMPERNRIDIFLQNDGHKYKLEVYFHDIISSCGCKLSTEDASDSSDAILLEVEIILCRIFNIIISQPSSISDSQYPCKVSICC